MAGLWELTSDTALTRRLQQGLAYWRPSANDNQYAHPLDFCMVIDTEKEEVSPVSTSAGSTGKRVPVPRKSHNFLPEFLKDGYVFDRLKPIDVTQSKGVSFTMNGNELSWRATRCISDLTTVKESLSLMCLSTTCTRKRRRMIFQPPQCCRDGGPLRQP